MTARRMKAAGPDRPGAAQIPSDDYAVEVDGRIYHPHRGEWVKVLRGKSQACRLAETRMLALQERLTRIQADDPGDETAETIAAAFEACLSPIAEEIARRVVDWTWTDEAGDRLPCPHRCPEAIQALSSPEFAYLLRLLGA